MIDIFNIENDKKENELLKDYLIIIVKKLIKNNKRFENYRYRVKIIENESFCITVLDKNYLLLISYDFYYEQIYSNYLEITMKNVINSIIEQFEMKNVINSIIEQFEMKKDGENE